MQTFRIRYRNTQGTLMRILNAASRRGLDLPLVQAEAADTDHQVTVMLEVNPKQAGQLYREWYSIMDVTHVASGAEAWSGHRPPSEVSMADVALEQSRSAARA
jgi:acetolactate synthase regulatory subunit